MMERRSFKHFCQGENVLISGDDEPITSGEDNGGEDSIKKCADDKDDKSENIFEEEKL